MMLINPKRARGNPDAERPAFDARLPDFVRGPGQAECRKRLSQLSVAIAGVGSVGLAGVDRLSRMGIAALLCADPARFKPASILTHPIVVPSNLDPPKACFGARHAARINPQMDVRYVIGKLEDVSLSVLRKYELMKVATDNLDSVLVLGRQARRLSIPLIREAVEGQTLTAQVAIYSNSSETSPCPVCGFGTWEWASIGKDKRFSCAGGETQSARELTMSIPSHCSLAADLGVQQTVKFVLGLGKPVADTMLSYFGYTNELSVAQLRQNPNCPCDHRAYTQVIVPDKLGKLTMADILNASG
ncbi:MAG: ThiF family adenylyltransferase, partial [Lentisphaerae bacterium]|nr:ThiF family adenylyltransferase [Lentisphaerota bacterium]